MAGPKYLMMRDGEERLMQPFPFSALGTGQRLTLMLWNIDGQLVLEIMPDSAAPGSQSLQRNIRDSLIVEIVPKGL
jgi:hypothetical protein